MTSVCCLWILSLSFLPLYSFVLVFFPFSRDICAAWRFGVIVRYKWSVVMVSLSAASLFNLADRLTHILAASLIILRSNKNKQSSVWRACCVWQFARQCRLCLFVYIQHTTTAASACTVYCYICAWPLNLAESSSRVARRPVPIGHTGSRRWGVRTGLWPAVSRCWKGPLPSCHAIAFS